MTRKKTAPATAGARREIATPLQGKTLSEKDIERGLDYPETIRILPDVHVLKVGGQSIMDRGRSAVYPVLEELVASKDRHSFLIGAGGGTRARHAYHIALDLEMPTGVLAAVGASTPLQNARMLQMLLARHGGIFVTFEDFPKLPLFLRLGCIPVMTGMPPYTYWEKPAPVGRIPANRTDAGVYLTGEFLGARSVIFIKDEKGLYTDDPKKNPKAKFIPRITVQELLEQDLDDLVVERVVLEYMTRATHVKSIQVINGLERGNITRALEGEHVGTIIEVA